MSDIQYPTNGDKNVNFSAEDDCGNRTRGNRMVTIIQNLLAGRYVDITESGDTATISVDPSADYYNKGEINEILADLDTVQFKIVTALPAVGALNVIYLVAKAAPDTGYDQYIWNTDDNQFHAIGDTDIDLSDYYTKLQTYQKSEVYNKTEADTKFQEKLTDDGSINTLSDTTTVSSVNLVSKGVKSLTLGAIWNYIVAKITGSASTAITTNLERSKVVVTDANQKLNVSGVYSAELEQLSGIDTTKTVQTQLNGKQAKLEETSEIYTIQDTTPFSRVNLSTNKVAPIRAQNIWNYIKGKLTGSISTCVDTNLTASKCVITNSSGKLATVGTTSTEIAYLSGVKHNLKIDTAMEVSAFAYSSSASAGYTINGDYETATPRRAWRMGGLAGVSFHCKGSTTANGANWTTIGQIPTGYRPKFKTPVVAMVYNNGTNEAAGGHITTSGNLILWTDPKVAGNNYQVRVNAIYLIAD